ncbi:ATP-binding protein [Hydrogenophaga sp. IBVHS2]|uniref:PAS domain-containing hybrid sensor histidine kinase/response regulator n=1 Tax=Hydrogenophaga sp. IBVHS2 TaxID=1985170 RepID=UPI0015C50838|nr:ATP-binding protein [Hydrogenophaga sp. IBVHS2]
MSDPQRRSPLLAIKPLERLFAGLPDPILLIDEDGLLRHANRAALRLLGRSETHFGVQTLASLVADDTTRCTALIKQGLRSAVPTPGRLDWRTADGRVLPCRVEIALLDAAAADTKALLWCRLTELRLGNSQFEVLNQQIEALKREVSRRQVAESEMRQQSEWLETVLQGVTEGVVATDTSGLVLFMNQVAADLTGAPRALSLGRSIKDVVQWHADDAPTPSAAVARTLQQGTRHLRLEKVKLQHRDGSEEWVQVSVSALQDESGGRSGAVLVMRSLDEEMKAEAQRRSLELQLRESQKMEALGTMAGGIAHDFNNIVAAILGNVELALGDVPPDSAGAVSLQEIRKAGRRARDLVQQILAFGRRQSNQRSVVRLHALLTEAESMLRAAVPPGAQLLLDAQPDLPPLMANATQIEQVLLNLIGNALQALHGRPEGRVSVAASAWQGDIGPAAPGELQVLPPCGWPGHGVCLVVQDNGSGMDAATLSRIFEPFFTTKPVGQGTGLGLAVVHGILAEHGAVLRVASTPGAGTTFSLWLPAALSVQSPQRDTAAHLESTAAPAPHLPHPVSRILYVDDDDAMAFLVRRFLERNGYQVHTCETPMDALEVLAAGADRFDLCITDHNMPGMSGLDLAAAMQAQGYRLPVVIASGFISDELRARSAEIGVAELLHKPDTVEELCRSIERVLTIRGEIPADQRR